MVLEFPSSGQISSSGSCCPDLCLLRDTTGSNASAGLVLTVTGTHKPIHHGKVEIPLDGKVPR